MRPRHVTHVITGLETGGAETMLLNVLAHTDRTRWSPAVVSLRDRGTLANEIERLGVPVHTLGLSGTWSSLVFGLPAWRRLRTLTPGVVMGWMYHANVAAWSTFGPQHRVLWNIQHTPDDLAHEKRRTARVIRLGARLSGHCGGIVYSSRRSAEMHARLGYDPTKAHVVPNGFDTEVFSPSGDARATWRARLGVPDGTVLIGRIGRNHPMKDYPGFLTAAAQLRRERPAVYFVLAGSGLDQGNTVLMGHVADLGLTGSVSLLGEVRPVQGLTAALDIGCSSSAFGEAFPGVVAEAMSCGVPCVTTDVGDSAVIVGDAGHVVPPRDTAALANALRALVDLGPEGRAVLGGRARARIEENFSIRHVAKAYEALLAAAAGAAPSIRGER